jgi:radical SAM protein with 4Fe4S-binding SPASM domain
VTNLIISRRCNQSCIYCFAGDQAAGPQPAYLSGEVFEQCLDFLDRSGIQHTRFLGGEPTLHPQFAEFVQRARERGKVIIVFTNGLMPPPALAALEALSPEQCSIILNIGSSGKPAGKLPAWQTRKDVIKRLGVKVQLGVTLYQPDVELDYLIDAIAETGCKRVIRVGLAQPILVGKNVHLPIRFYPQVGERLLGFAERAASAGIKIEFDCGFVRCMFTDAAVARLQGLGADLGWRCSPIIDIDTDGNIFHCFPLSGKYKVPLNNPTESNSITAGNLREEFATMTAPYRQAGIYKDCSSCLYKHNLTCSGGCLVHIIHRFSSEPIHLSIRY